MKGEKLLRALILNGIRSEEDSPQECKKHHSKETDFIAFQWALNDFLKEGRLYKRSLHRECKDWFKGLPMAIPYWNSDIEELGLNSETYWSDLATVFLNEVQTNVF